MPNVQGAGERAKEPAQTARGPLQTDDLFCHLILTLKNRKVGTELISYFSDTSGTASASNFKIKEFKRDYKKILFYYFNM